MLSEAMVKTTKLADTNWDAVNGTKDVSNDEIAETNGEAAQPVESRSSRVKVALCTY